MTMPYERTRALLSAGGFLIELARDPRLPLDVRQRAVVIARHFPTFEWVAFQARLQHAAGLGEGLASPDAADGWQAHCRYGALRDATRLKLPAPPDSAARAPPESHGPKR